MVSASVYRFPSPKNCRKKFLSFSIYFVEKF